MVTVAPETAAPLLSDTVPSRLPVAVCANRTWGSVHTNKTKQKSEVIDRSDTRVI
jgi:hypothetical protein